MKRYTTAIAVVCIPPLVLVMMASAAVHLNDLSLSSSAPATPTAAPFSTPLNITVHDAVGRTFKVKSQIGPNGFSFDGTTGLTLDYTSDQVLCSGFQP